MLSSVVLLLHPFGIWRHPLCHRLLGTQPPPAVAPTFQTYSTKHNDLQRVRSYPLPTAYALAGSELFISAKTLQRLLVRCDSYRLSYRRVLANSIPVLDILIGPAGVSSIESLTRQVRRRKIEDGDMIWYCEKASGNMIWGIE